MPHKALKIAVAYRGIPHSKGWATGDNLVRAFKKLGHDVYPYGNYYETNRRLSKRRLPKELDLLVYCECNDNDPQYRELRYQKARARVYWDFDIDWGREELTSNFLKYFSFDVIFFANLRLKNTFERLAPRVVPLPYAFDEVHFRPLGIKKTVEVALIGSPYAERAAYIKKLKKDGVDVKFIGGKYKDDFVRAINQLKIHLNLNVAKYGGDGLLVGRVWETIGCGTFLLTQRKDFIEDFFKDGEHLILFDTPEECAEKIKYYLAHEKERERIAKAGYEYGLKHHTYVARAQTILDGVSDLLDRPVWSPRPTLREKAKKIFRAN